MSENNSLNVEYRPSWAFNKDLFGDTKKVANQLVAIFLCALLPMVSKFFIQNPSITKYIFYYSIIFAIITIIWGLRSVFIKYKDTYYIDENKNLIVTRCYSKNKSISKTVSSDDIKGLKIYQIYKSNSKVKLVALDLTKGNFVLNYCWAADAQKIQDFFSQHYPELENKGNFDAIEAGIKRFNNIRIVIILICVIFYLLKRF